MALFFAYHVLWPGGPAAGFDPVAAAIGMAAAIALIRFKFGVIAVVVGSGFAGLALRFLT